MDRDDISETETRRSRRARDDEGGTSRIDAHRGLFGDIELHVDDTGGSGRPVVLIHGWPLTAQSWAPQVPALVAAGHRVVAYDRRGFGRSDKPLTGYTYDSLADDLDALLTQLDLRDVTLVGFSMGGGEVVRYLARRGSDRVRSVVLASAITPYMLNTPGNPDGPLSPAEAARMAASLTTDREGFYDDFMTRFFSAGGRLAVPEAVRREAIAQCLQAAKPAALESMAAFGATDFRDDLRAVTVPALIIHGDSDAVVPFEGSGARTHEALAGSELHIVRGAPHGVNASHPEEWNERVLAFLAR